MLRYVRNIHAKWDARHLEYLEKKGIKTQHGYINIEEDSQYFEIITQLKDAQDLKDDRNYAIFDKEDLDEAKQFMLLRCGPAPKVFPYNGKDVIFLRKDVFGEACSNCLRPLQEQINPFTLMNEMPFPSSKHLFFTIHWAHNYLFTDKARYETHLKKWGLKAREVLIGKNKIVSKNLVQLIIPKSPYPLEFGNSTFGKTITQDGTGKTSEQFVTCPVCNLPRYSSSILDFFPSFEKDFDFHLVHTQEWFGGFYQLIVSKDFAEFLVARKIAKWDSSYFIPVKKFQPQ